MSLIKEITSKNHRYLRSKRGQLSIAAVITILISAILVMVGLWQIAAVLFSVALSLLVIISSTSLMDTNWILRDVKRSLSTSEQLSRQRPTTVGLTANDLRAIESATVRAYDSDFRKSHSVPSGLAVNGGAPDWIQQWIQINSFGNNPSLSTAVAVSLSDRITRSSSKSILYIGSPDGVYWLNSVLESLDRKQVQLVGLVSKPDTWCDTSSHLDKLSQLGIRVEPIARNRNPADAIAGLTAYLTEEIFIDLGSTGPAEFLYRYFPSKFIDWMSTEVQITVMNSKDHDVRPSVEKFMMAFSNLRIIEISSDSTVAYLTKASK